MELYKSYGDLADCIRRNIWKIPSDVDLIVGVPRSGMIPALMLAEFLNKRCTDLDTFLEGRETSHGKRGNMLRRGKTGKVLVLDDATCRGESIVEVRGRLAQVEDRFEIIYGCVYAESEKVKKMLDFWMEDLSQPYLKEWNILHLFKNKVSKSMWDIDGLLCKDPPEDKNQEAYEEYLPNAIPMIIPTNRVGALVTYRLERYRAVTEEWLQKQGVGYGQLVMFDAPSRDVRNTTESSANYKARLYREAGWAEMFIESDRRQAERIFQKTGKPVFCYENGKMYI